MSVRKTLFQHNWLIYKVLDREIERAAICFAKGNLLDLGCGDMPYKKMFEPYIQQHFGFDHPSTAHFTSGTDVLGTIHALPFRNDSFDTVLCTEVLEHVEEPKTAISEIHRVLKKEGMCILTTPFFWHIHEAPRDFYRYSKYGLKYLFEANNFSIIEINAISGFWVTIMQEVVYYLVKFRRNFFLSIPVVVLSWLLQRLGYILNKIDKDENFATEYIVIAKKH